MNKDSKVVNKVPKSKLATIMALPALYLRLKDVAVIGACEGYEQEPTDTLVNAIYACTNQQVIPLMRGLRQKLRFNATTELHDTWIGKSICLLFSCRLVLSMTNVVVRDWYSDVIGQAIKEMLRRVSSRLDFKSKRHFVRFVKTVEAVLFTEGQFQYICGGPPLNKLQKFDAHSVGSTHPICTEATFLKDKLFERDDCHFVKPGPLQKKITLAEITALLESLRSKTASDLTLYEPDPNYKFPLAGGTFAQVYTRLQRRQGEQKRFAEKVVSTNVDEYPLGMAAEHVREIVILNMSEVKECQFIAILHQVIVDPRHEKIHLYMPWRMDLVQFMRRQYPDTKPQNVVTSVTCQMLSALKVLYNLNVAHRDLKTENILVSYDQFLADSQGGTKIGERWIEITDFGQARQIDPGIKNTGQLRYDYASLWFRSPEALGISRGKYERVEQAGDVWSAGCILYEVATGDPLFSPEQSVVGMLKRILTLLRVSVEATWEEDDEHPLHGIFAIPELQTQDLDNKDKTLENLLGNAHKLEKHDSDYLQNLKLAIQAMLTLDSTKRPTAADLLPDGANELALLHGFDAATTRF